MWKAFLEALELGTVSRGGYQDGCVVDLLGVPQKPLYLVGDIHAKPRRIADILQHAKLEPELEQDRAVLVFLGDLFHREDDDRAGEMESSLETLHEVMKLKTRFPRNVYTLLGNHEFTRTESTKRGYFQGTIFREALQALGQAEDYERFLQASPLVVVHPRVVGVHAGPTLSAGSLEEIKHLEIRDVHPMEQPAPVRELTFTRHVDWSPNPSKSYNDYQVEDFLKLCGVPTARLVTGHTPLARETDWNWDIGRHLTVIFAAGREVGYLRVSATDEKLIRVGRSTVKDDEKLVLDRWPLSQFQEHVKVELGRRRLCLSDLSKPIELLPDVLYRFDYPGFTLPLRLPESDLTLNITHYRHLSASSQAYYEQGFYLTGNEFRQEVLKLKQDLAVLVGGSSVVEGVRFSWGDPEFAVLRQHEEGVFDLRPLVEGMVLG